MQRHDHFSEKFLELSLWACPCRRAASCQLFFVKSGCGSAMSKFILPLLSPCTDFAQEKSRERTAAPCKKQSKHNQTHTSLSECLINENRSKYFSENIGQAVIGGDDEAGYGSGKKAKSETEAPLPNSSLPPKPTSCTSRSISTPKTPRTTLKITHDECFSSSLPLTRKRQSHLTSEAYP